MARKRKRERRLHQEPIVTAVASILDAGEPTRFRYEGACRAGLRAHLCLKGWEWQRADDKAAVIVELALARLGIARPTWAQGQPEASNDHRYFCVGCGGPIGESEWGGRHRKYCSDECRWRDVARKRWAHIHADAEAEKLAFDAARRNGTLRRTCDQCGATFEITSRFKLKQRFCTHDCHMVWKRGTALPLRTCPSCKQTYKPKRSKQRYCCLACRNAGYAAGLSPRA